MADINNFKGELQTFCARHLFSTPKYKSIQVLQTSEWRSQCIVTFSKRLLLNEATDSKDDDEQKVFITEATKQKKKESHAYAAEKMLSKLESILSDDVLLNIRHEKHMKKLIKDKSKLLYTLQILESLFSSSQIENSVVMQKLIESSKEQWISLDDILKMPTFQDSFGEYGWRNDQYQKSKDVFIKLIEDKSEILEISSDKQYIRRKELFDILIKDQTKSEKLKKCGNELFKQDKFEEAINKYLDALKYNKNDHKILMNLSLTYLKVKDMENALEFATKAINSKPNASKPYARAAQCLFAMKRLNQAIATIKIALALNNNNGHYKRLYSEWTSLLDAPLR